MNDERTRRERSLLGATVLSGVLALFSQAGGPFGCSGQQIAKGNVPVGADAGVEPGLELSSRKGDTKHIAAGTMVRINGSDPVVLVGVALTSAKVITAHGATIHRTAIVKIESVSVVGESHTGAGAGIGAIGGGLTGVVVGTAAYPTNRGTGALCIGGLGVAVGAGVGAAVGSGSETEYRMGESDWHIVRPITSKAEPSPEAP